MNLLIAVPKAGTHLFGNMLNATRWVVALKPEPQTRPLEMFEESAVISERMGALADLTYRGHIPCRPDLLMPVERFDKAFLLVRDPLDIIVSMAHFVDIIRDTPVNYRIAGGRLSDVPLNRRIDFLIDRLRPVFDMFDRWRNAGMETLYYDQFIHDPEAVAKKLAAQGFGKKTDILARAQKREYTYRTATSGDWRKYMTRAQAERAQRIYRGLEWNPYQ